MLFHIKIDTVAWNDWQMTLYHSIFTKNAFYAAENAQLLDSFGKVAFSFEDTSVPTY